MKDVSLEMLEGYQYVLKVIIKVVYFPCFINTVTRPSISMLNFPQQFSYFQEKQPFEEWHHR